MFEVMSKKMVKKGLSLIASSILEKRMGFDIAPTYNNPSDIYMYSESHFRSR